MSSPRSWSEFLARPVTEFLDSMNSPEISLRLGAFCKAAGITDVCGLTVSPAHPLPEEMLHPEDFIRLREHLAFFDVGPGFGPGAKITFTPST